MDVAAGETDDLISLGLQLTNVPANIFAGYYPTSPRQRNYPNFGASYWLNLMSGFGVGINTYKWLKWGR